MKINHKAVSAKSQINELRDSEIRAGYLWNDVLFDSDPKSLFLISGKVADILAKKALDVAVADFIWRSADNTNYTFTADEFLAFSSALTSFVEATYIKSWEQKAML